MYLMRYLDLFNTYEGEHAGPIEYSLRFPGNDQSYPHLYFSACVHGNEIGSLPAFFDLIKKLAEGKNNYPGTITVSLGNIEAMQAGVRYKELDMNRHFGDKATSPYEAARANQLCQLIDECDIFIDLHQTIEPTSEPFFVLSDKPENRNFAQALELINKAILRSPTKDSYLTATTYAFRKDKVAVTVELSQKGINNQATILCEKIIDKTQKLASKIQQGLTYQDLAANSPQLTWLAISYYQKFDGPLCKLVPGFSNLDAIKENQILGQTQSGENFFAPFSGFVLFPKYVKRDSSGAAISTPPKDIIAITKTVE